MRNDSPTIKLSPLEEQRFGIRTARALITEQAGGEAVEQFCGQHQVSLLIARSPTSDIRLAQALLESGFGLVDTLVYYRRDLRRTPIPDDEGAIPVRPLRPGEELAVKAVAEAAFRDYFGHYHADSRLDRAACDAAYADWAWRSCCDPEVADEVLVAVCDEAIVGFATLRLNDPTEGEGVLFGVAPEAQGRGVYRSFTINAMQWCLARGADYMVISTQIANVAVQKVWARVGFEYHHGYYTFHKWFG